MRQRVSIARAFAVDPEILLCDEPFSSLDEMTARDLRAEFVRLVRQSNKTAVFITHQINEAMEIGDRVLVFHRPARIAYETRLGPAHHRAPTGARCKRTSCACCRSSRRRRRRVAENVGGAAQNAPHRRFQQALCPPYAGSGLPLVSGRNGTSTKPRM